jgi:hypothetical protein
VNVNRRSKKIAAALAAVETLLAEEAAVAENARRRRPSMGGLSPWALAGRLATMAARSVLPSGRRV